MTHWLPNALSLSRIGLGLVFPLVPLDWQLSVIVLAAVTDAADGRLARALKVNGWAGRYLDPVADKCFVVAVLATLLVQQTLSPLALLLLGLRDVVVVLGTMGLAAAGRWDVLLHARPTPLGKLTTAAQFGYLILLVWVREPLPGVLAGVAVISGLAGLDYLRRGWQGLRSTGGAADTRVVEA
jgi:cardiolipin synthase (CMP-forming)